MTRGLMVYVGGRKEVGPNLDTQAPEEGDTDASLEVQAFLVF